MVHDAFISYSSKDASVAGVICSSLEAEGFQCWMAPRDILPGENYSRSIITAIGESRLAILVFSADSNESNHVLSEIDRAYNKNKPIILFRLQDVPLSPSLEYYLSTAQWQNALQPPVERHIPALVETIKLILKRMSDPASPLSRPKVKIREQFLVEPYKRLRFIFLYTFGYMLFTAILSLLFFITLPAFSDETKMRTDIAFVFISIFPILLNLAQVVLLNKAAKDSRWKNFVAKLGFRA